MRYLSCIAAVALFLAPAPAAADEQDWADASDVARTGLIVAAFGVPLLEGDGNGAKQAAYSLGSTFLVTAALKETIHENRPDDSNDKSFPSGHTSISFAAAATLNNRYGWKVGLPAHAVAAFVGLARVEADKHYWHDVIVGAAIGEAAGLIFTKKRDDGVHMLPWGDAHGGGVSLAMRF